MYLINIFKLELLETPNKPPAGCFHKSSRLEHLYIFHLILNFCFRSKEFNEKVLNIVF